MVNTKTALYLTSGLALASALPISVNDWYNSIQHVLKSISDQLPKQKPSTNTTAFISSIISLIPLREYESWISTESEIAFESIVKNIGGYGEGLDEVMRGAVIASPSKSHPNYFYQVSKIPNCFLVHVEFCLPLHTVKIPFYPHLF